MWLYTTTKWLNIAKIPLNINELDLHYFCNADTIKPDVEVMIY